MSARYTTVPRLGVPFETPVGTFVRLGIHGAADPRSAIAVARRSAQRHGWQVVDITSCVAQPFDPVVAGMGKPSGGYVVEVRIS